MKAIIGIIIVVGSFYGFSAWANSSWFLAPHSLAATMVAAGAFTLIFFGPLIGGSLIFGGGK